MQLNQLSYHQIKHLQSPNRTTLHQNGLQTQKIEPYINQISQYEGDGNVSFSGTWDPGIYEWIHQMWRRRSHEEKGARCDGADGARASYPQHAAAAAGMMGPDHWTAAARMEGRPAVVRLAGLLMRGRPERPAAALGGRGGAGRRAGGRADGGLGCGGVTGRAAAAP